MVFHLEATSVRKLPIYPNDKRGSWISNTKTNTTPRLTMIHCGYKIDFEPIIPILRKYIGGITITCKHAYTAVHYMENEKMLSWFSTAKPIDGYIKGLYVTKKNVVCVIYIGRLILYATLINNSNSVPISLKIQANKGIFGPLIEICEPKETDPTINDNKITVKCTPVFYAKESGSYHDIYSERVEIS
jgi:hypothetical protein